MRRDGRRVSVGNPHVVVLVAEDPAAFELRAFAAAARAVAGDVNVEVAKLHDGAHLTLRVDERGVGETLACGTGACAAVAAATGEHGLAETVRVEVPGGVLLVRAGPVRYELAGPAQYVFEGTLR